MWATRQLGAGVDVRHHGVVRDRPSILHCDLDAFFAAVEQRDKPSLRGRPVVVGGLGRRGVVATASYEARAFGIHSAMPMAEARRRCPSAAFLAGRFPVYRAASDEVMAIMRGLTSLVEPVSLDEAYLDLAGAGERESDAALVAATLREQVRRSTGLTMSVGVGTSKLMAKLASEMAKPDGIEVVAPGTELELLSELPVRRLPGVGAATEQRLAGMGIRTVAQVRDLTDTELVAALGSAHGLGLAALAQAHDTRKVEPIREAKSVSVEDTFEDDVTDRVLLEAVLRRMVEHLSRRLRAHGTSGRTVTLKARNADFTTLTRSTTLPGPTDEVRTLAGPVLAMFDEVDLGLGLRLVGVGVSGLSPWTQPSLLDAADDESPHLDSQAASTPVAARPAPARRPAPPPSAPRWEPGADVVHEQRGRGWVWGSGRGRVTVRFETRDTEPGPVCTFDHLEPRLRLLAAGHSVGTAEGHEGR